MISRKVQFDLSLIESTVDLIEYHVETKTPLTLGLIHDIEKLKGYIDEVDDVWCKESTKDLADEIKSKLANVSPPYLFVFNYKDNTAVNNVCYYIKKRKELLAAIRAWEEQQQKQLCKRSKQSKKGF